MTSHILKRPLLFGIILLVFGFIVVSAYAKLSKYQSHALSAEVKDVVEKDFIATISQTDNAFEFVVTVKKTNKGADKHIGFFDRRVGLIPIDASGKALASSMEDIFSYAKPMDGGFDSTNKPEVDQMSGRVRLVRRGLKPGIYSIKPYIRIVETGRDRISGPYVDMGSVTVKAGNSIKVELKQPWLVKPLTSTPDVVDRDFTATIAPTKMRNVFQIVVKRINPKVDKSINSHHEVFVDLELVDSIGRALKGDFCIQTFAEYVGEGFGPHDEEPFPTSRKGKIRLITTGIPSGNYIVKPVVRIPEEGRDQVLNPRADLSSVAVPAGNSVKVTIK